MDVYDSDANDDPVSDLESLTESEDEPLAKAKGKGNACTEPNVKAARSKKKPKKVAKEIPVEEITEVPDQAPAASTTSDPRIAHANPVGSETMPARAETPGVDDS